MRFFGGTMLAVLLGGCAGHDAGSHTLERGRTYTEWLFAGRLDTLWRTFSPEMKRTFPGTPELAAFVGRAATQLGHERGAPAESVAAVAGTNIYTRTVTFDRANRPVRVQWTMNDAGLVTGLLVNPVLNDSTHR